MKTPAPVVMLFSGLDPTGGAGLQADIEAAASMGCHAAPIVTCLTVQNTQNVIGVTPVSPTLIVEQARAVLEDMPVKAFKCGLLGSAEQVEALHTLMRDYAEIPLILDPVLVAGGGAELVDTETLFALRELLLPRATVVTPNTPELRALARGSGSDTLEACAMEVLSHGCDFVLVTGAHEATAKVVNTLYGNHRRLQEYQWDRLPGVYHGSGCTLASAIAGLLAQGQEPFSAISAAQRYTWNTLKHAEHLGMGQMIPDRLYWAGNVEAE
ncbi:MAG: hydroxymethylpyrimidine/phosphomethylpyrimidine kinase [Thiotrichales bacterium]